MKSNLQGFYKAHATSDQRGSQDADQLGISQLNKGGPPTIPLYPVTLQGAACAGSSGKQAAAAIAEQGLIDVNKEQAHHT